MPDNFISTANDFQINLASAVVLTTEIFFLTFRYFLKIFIFQMISPDVSRISSKVPSQGNKKIGELNSSFILLSI